MADKFYVAIEGPIGVGKTTLARLMQKELAAELLLEVFEENPFLSDFYADRQRYAFQTQIFFLLSRYRQQHAVIERVLQHSALISDYTFAKDQLFARLNLSNDELAVYEKLHSVLAEKIPVPDLVVYLKADLDTLLERIALRDRTYERAMSRQYLADLGQAYEQFFARYDQSPVLTMDSDNLNFVHNPDDLAYVRERIKSALGAGTHQRPLLETPAPEQAQAVVTSRRRLSDLQQWHRASDVATGLEGDVYHDFIGLQQVLGGLAGELGQVWSIQQRLVEQAGNRAEAHERALQQRVVALQKELAEVLACLLRLANDLGVSLEEAFVSRIQEDGAILNRGQQ